MPNDDTQKRQVRGGFAILGVLILSALLIFNLDLVVDWTRGYVDVVALVPGSGGVRVGSSVWVEGVEAGRVTHVGFVGHADSVVVAIQLRLRERARDLVRRDSDVYTGSRRLIGEPLVHIDAGSPAVPAVEDGDTLISHGRFGLEELIDEGRRFPATLAELHQGLDRLRRLADARAPEVAAVIEGLAALTEAAAPFADDVGHGTLARLVDDPELPRRVSALHARIATLTGAADRALARYAPGGDGPLAGALVTVKERAARLGEELARFEARMAAGEGTLPRMARDSALQVAVRGVQAQIDSLMAEAASIAAGMLPP